MTIVTSCVRDDLTTVVTTATLVDVAYRRPGEPLRGAWARHIDKWMQDEQLSIQGAHDRLHAGLHLSPKSRSAFRPIYFGKRQPTEDEAQYLATVMDWPPDADADAEPQPVGDSALVAAMAQQTVKLNAILDEIQRVYVLQSRLVLDTAEGAKVFLERNGFRVLPAEPTSDTTARDQPVQSESTTNGRGAR